MNEPKRGRKLSKIWKFFVKQENNKSLCLIEKCLISGHVSTNLIKHLKKKHPFHYNQFLAQDDCKQLEHENNSQLIIKLKEEVLALNKRLESLRDKIINYLSCCQCEESRKQEIKQFLQIGEINNKINDNDNNNDGNNDDNNQNDINDDKKRDFNKRKISDKIIQKYNEMRINTRVDERQRVGRPKKGQETSSTKKKRVWVMDKCPCDWPGCDKKFPTNNKLKCHMRTHTGERPFACDWPGCNKRYHIKGNLILHKNLHLKVKSCRCQWPGCQESFIRVEQLDKHVYQKHTGKMPYLCDWPGCGFQTCYRQRFKWHKMRHTGEKPHSCPWPSCESRFTEAHQLKAHVRKHTGERPYCCEWPGCDRRYKNRQAMRLHMERIHQIRA